MNYTSKTSPHHVRRQLIGCPDSYVQSVGRNDMSTLGHVADNEQGTGTVLRLIMGATTEMPLRALGYVSSAIRCAGILPCQQVQIIHANNLGAAVNGVNIETAREQARLLATVTRGLIQVVAPDIVTRVLHAEDKPCDLTPFMQLAEAALRQDTNLQTGLSEKGSKHGGDFVAYAAAHCAYQDTDLLELAPLLDDSPSQVRAERIVSIGCQQERLFYSARMAMRQRVTEAETPTINLLDTAQIFTDHLTPPYFIARGGEQTLGDALVNGVDLAQAVDPSTLRDLQHTQDLLEATL